MKLFGNTGTGQRARQSVPVNEQPHEKELLQDKEEMTPIELPEEAQQADFFEDKTVNETAVQPKKTEPMIATTVINIPEEEAAAPVKKEAKTETFDVPVEELKDEDTGKNLSPRPAFVREKNQKMNEKSNRGIIKGIILLAFSIAVLLITLFSVFFYLVKADQKSAGKDVKETTANPQISTEALESSAPDIDERVNAVAPQSQTEGIYNLLLIGIDDNDKYTDTVMMLHVDANTHQLSALSLPHNTLVYGDYDVPMIDEVYHNSGKGEGGIKALKEKVESMFGFPMDAHIALNSESFARLMDCLGTITFDVPETLPSGLEKGSQELDAEAAKALIQTKEFSDETIRRERVQLDFLQAIGTQKLSSLTQTELEILAKTFSELLDSDLTQENFIYLLLEFQSCDFANLKSYLMPGRIIKYYSRDYHQLDENAMLAILNMSFNPYEDDLDEDDVEIRMEKETDVPESDYIREKQNNDDEDDDNNGGDGGDHGGYEPEPIENNPDENNPDENPPDENTPDENNPDEP